MCDPAYPCWFMDKLEAALNLISSLAAWSSSREPPIPQIFFTELGFLMLAIVQHRHCHGAGMDPPAALRYRHALNAVSTSFMLEAGDVFCPDLGEAGRELRLVWSADCVEVTDIGSGKFLDE